jgi:hypothetical protein
VLKGKSVLARIQDSEKVANFGYRVIFGFIAPKTEKVKRASHKLEKGRYFM